MENYIIPQYLKEHIGENTAVNELARVIVEHRESYIVQSPEGIFRGEITGNIRFTARSRNDFPAVGDWVQITKMDKESAIILSIYPRKSVLSRKAVGSSSEMQLIASNIDVAFIVQSVGHDFNLNRLERYLSICNAADIHPIMLLTKTDLVGEEELQELKTMVQQRRPDLEFMAVSNEDGSGLDVLQNKLEAGLTYCFMGSSGVGKSTIINHLLEKETIKTSEISESTSKGRHTTTHRELFQLPNGSSVIDTPGMRELGMADQSSGIEMTYDQIGELAQECRYKDCTHSGELGCAVSEAVENGELSAEVYENYLRLKREQEHFSTSVHEKNRQGKVFGKMVKEAVKQRKRNKY